MTCAEKKLPQISSTIIVLYVRDQFTLSQNRNFLKGCLVNFLTCVNEMVWRWCHQLVSILRLKEDLTINYLNLQLNEHATSTNALFSSGIFFVWY